MRKGFCLVLLAALGAGSAPAFAWGDGCEFKADRSAGVDARGVEKIVIRAGAGDMKIVGRPTAVRIEARGVACAGKQELLDATNISVRREENVVYIETTLPQNGDGGWNWGKNAYAYIDLGIALPSTIPVDAIDSSGDSVIEDLAALTLQDSSGDLEISRIAGLADIGDSSGDINLDVAGSVKLRDSSGDIDVARVRGDIEVESDSSGDIEIEQVEGDVRIAQDSSGTIRAEDVKGSVVVESDSSGDIYAARVGGDFTVREDSSGTIGHDAITGRVSTPDHTDGNVEK